MNPEQIDAERYKYLSECRTCGCRGTGMCKRMIDRRDGSVWPMQDTGFRVGQPLLTNVKKAGAL